MYQTPIKTKNTYTGYSDPYKQFDKICEKHNIKPRQNAVLAYELLLTFSPEMSGQINNRDFLKRAKKWLETEFPSDAILSIDLHLDETTPHIHAVVMPLIEKTVRGKVQMRLSAKDYTGTPELLRARQTRFAEAMKPLGLERGLKHSGATHTDIATYHDRLNRDLEAANNEIESIFSQIPEKPSITDFFNIKKVIQKLQNASKAIAVLAQNAVKVGTLEKEVAKLAEDNARLRRSAITSDVFTNQELKELVLQREKQHKATLEAQYKAPTVEPAPEPIKASYDVPIEPGKHSRHESDETLKK